jgi:hypothetical protein
MFLEAAVKRIFAKEELDLYQLKMLTILIAVDKAGNADEVDWVLNAIGLTVPYRARRMAKLRDQLEGTDFYPDDESELGEALDAIRRLK